MNDLPSTPPPGGAEPPGADSLDGSPPALGGDFAPPPGPTPGPPAGPPLGPPFGAPAGPFPPGAPPAPPGGFPAPAPPGGSSNGLAIGALVCGITGITTFWMCGLGAIPGVTAVILGAVALTTARRRDDRSGRGPAIGGVVTGAIAIVASIGFVVAIGLGSGTSTDTVPDSFTPSSPGEEYRGGIDTDPADGTCDQERFLQDPDCQGEIFTGELNSDPRDDVCDQERFMQDPDC